MREIRFRKNIVPVLLRAKKYMQVVIVVRLHKPFLNTLGIIFIVVVVVVVVEDPIETFKKASAHFLFLFVVTMFLILRAHDTRTDVTSILYRTMRLQTPTCCEEGSLSVCNDVPANVQRVDCCVKLCIVSPQ